MPFAMMGDSAAQFEIAEIWQLHYKCKILVYHWYCQSALGGHHKAAMNGACILLTTQRGGQTQLDSFSGFSSGTLRVKPLVFLQRTEANVVRCLSVKAAMRTKCVV